MSIHRVINGFSDDITTLLSDETSRYMPPPRVEEPQSSWMDWGDKLCGKLFSGITTAASLFGRMANWSSVTNGLGSFGV